MLESAFYMPLYIGLGSCGEEAGFGDSSEYSKAWQIAVEGKVMARSA